MNDRDVVAQPGDNSKAAETYDTDLEGEPLDQPAEGRPLVMPRKADVGRTDQARRAAKPARAVATPTSRDGARKRGLAQARPTAERAAADEPDEAVELDEYGEPVPVRPRLKSAHPLSRIRREERNRGLAATLGLDRLAALIAGRPRAPQLGMARPSLRSGRPHLRRPTLRGAFGFAGMTATFAIVTGLLVTLPSHPAAPASTGSIYGINWHGAVKPPAAKLDFGPYFTTLDNELLMLGTTISTTSSAASGASARTAAAAAAVSTTTLWSSTDGTTWTQRSGTGAFGIDGRRFVAQGISADGQGGLVVVGNSLGTSPTDVIATAWHSRDGSSWSLMQVSGGGGQEMIAGVASQPGAVVAAGNGVAWLSTDGSTWSAQVLPGAVTSSTAFTPRAVGSWDGGFVIVGLANGTKTTTSAIWYSSTGRDWKQATTPLAGFDVRGIAAVGDTITAVGIDLSPDAPAMAASWSSTDGDKWIKATAPTDLPTVAMDGVAAVNGSLVAFGAPAPATTPVASAGPTLPGSTPVPPAAELVWVSENGRDWLAITSTAAPLLHARMASLGNKVVLIGTAGTGLSLISGDLSLGKARQGLSPSAPPANFALTLKAGDIPMIVDVTKDYTMGPVTATNQRFYLFATGPSGTEIYSAPVGSSLWSQEAAPKDLTSSILIPVAPPSASPKASGSHPAATATTPAASSTPAESAAPAQVQTIVGGRPVVMQAISDGEGGILAAGRITNSSGNNGMIWHLRGGKWQQVVFEDDAPPEISSIAAGPGGGFVASSDQGGGSQILYSTDGDNWQAGSIAVGDGFALSVATYRYGYVAVGTDPTRQGVTTAWTSPDGRTWTLRTDWKLPPNVTALFGMGNTLVAAANTATSPVSASAVPKPSASPSAKATPTPKPTATSAPVQSSTWWWSATGVVWQQSGLQTSNGDWAIANGRILVVSAPTKTPSAWTTWSSADGRSWQRPGSDSLSFAGSKVCTIASINDKVIVVGLEAPGALKGYSGSFGGK
jgi:hypothetical protein